MFQFKMLNYIFQKKMSKFRLKEKFLQWMICSEKFLQKKWFALNIPYRLQSNSLDMTNIWSVNSHYQWLSAVIVGNNCDPSVIRRAKSGFQRRLVWSDRYASRCVPMLYRLYWTIYSLSIENWWLSLRLEMKPENM